VDPRGWVLRGVSSRVGEYRVDMAGYYDVIIGLHPEGALREVVSSARVRPVVVVPCCNFWLRDTKLSRDELLDAIEKHQAAYGTSEDTAGGPEKPLRRYRRWHLRSGRGDRNARLA
jgi:hypothetical protein